MHIVGIDTGGSYTRIWNGIQPVRKMATPRSYPQYLQMLFATLKEYEPMQTLVIALPAVIASHRIVKAPNLGDGWNQHDIEADIRNLLTVNGHIHIYQDTEAAGYAVQMQELVDLDPTMIVTLSTGVGGALVSKQQVLPLEIGHMPLDLSHNNLLCSCRQSGCVEADLSGTSIFKQTGIQVEHMQDPQFWTNYGRMVGQFFLVLTTLFSLKQILLFGGVSNSAPRFLPQTIEYISSHLKNMPCPEIHLSRLGEHAGVMGAYYTGIGRTKEHTVDEFHNITHGPSA